MGLVRMLGLEPELERMPELGQGRKLELGPERMLGLEPGRKPELEPHSLAVEHMLRKEKVFRLGKKTQYLVQIQVVSNLIDHQLGGRQKIERVPKLTRRRRRWGIGCSKERKGFSNFSYFGTIFKSEQIPELTWRSVCWWWWRWRLVILLLWFLVHLVLCLIAWCRSCSKKKNSMSQETVTG